MDIGKITRVKNQNKRPDRRVKSSTTGRTRTVRDADDFVQLWVEDEQGQNIRLCLTDTMFKKAIYLAEQNPV
jgi:hypothetical protein